MKGDKVPFLIRPLTKAIANQVDSMYFNPNFKTHFDFLESQLATSPDGGEYFCGKDLTAVDILMSFPLQAGKHHMKLINAQTYPKLDAYVGRLEAQEGWKRSVKRIEDVTGEPFALRL